MRLAPAGEAYARQNATAGLAKSGGDGMFDSGPVVWEWREIRGMDGLTDKSLSSESLEFETRICRGGSWSKVEGRVLPSTGPTADGSSLLVNGGDCKREGEMVLGFDSTGPVPVAVSCPCFL